MSYIFAPAVFPAVPIWEEKNKFFPVHRVYCVGANYADHVAELGAEGRERPFFFSKPADCLVLSASDEAVPIPYARDTNNLCLEVELVVAIGKTAPDNAIVLPEEAEDYIWGYAAGVEFTRRNWQNFVRENRQPWEKAKAFDHSALITPIRPKERTPDMDDSSIWLYVNGQQRQKGNTNQMIWKIPEIISELSTAWQLTAGDLIYTGTPKGSGPIEKGQSFEGGVQGAGVFYAKII